MPDAHLLVVDDSPEVRTIVAYLCKRAGYRSDGCPSVAAAWEYLQHSQPTLILLDIQMPPVNGIELCRRVRAAEPLRELPIALFTHWGAPGDVLAGLEAGADYVVAKDLVADPAAWQRRLGEILRRVHGEKAHRLVTYSETTAAVLVLPANWVDLLNQSLQQGMARRLGVEISRVVVRRAMRQVFAALTDAPTAPVGSRSPDRDLEMAFPPEWNWLEDRPQAVWRLAAALADQLECLLGNEECAAFRAALAPLLPGSEGWRTP